MFTRDLFHVLGFAPVLGRSPELQDELPGRKKVAWLSYSLWRRRFDSDPGVVGKILRLNEESYIISGVLPVNCVLPLEGKNPDLYIPLEGYDGRSVRSLTGIGRLARSTSLQTASTEMRGLATRLTALAPTTNTGVGFSIRPLHEELLGNRSTSLLLLMGAVLVLLLIACSNVANLILTRSVLRSHDVAVRVSLGASRGHIFRQSLIEALCLSLLGGAGGILLGTAGLSLFRFLPQFLTAGAGVTQLRPAQMDWMVVSFALGVSVLVAIFFAFVPSSVILSSAPTSALHSRGLSGNTRRGGGGLRSALIALQVAMSAVLLLNGGVLLRSFLKLLDRNPGFDAENVVAFGLGLPEARYSNDAKLLQFHSEVLHSLAAMPDVQGAGAIWGLPLSGKRPNSGFYAEGEPIVAGVHPHSASVAVASGGYFATLHIPLMAGRTFGPEDGPRQPAVVMVNEAFDRAFFGAHSALGKRILFDWNNEAVPPGTWREIVGIVGDTRQQSLDTPAAPEIYLPIGQYPPDGLYYVVRTHLPASVIDGRLRQLIRSLDSELEELEPRPLSSWMSASLTDRHATVALLLFFAVAALLISAVGVFGAISYNVGTQMRELAIRLALGATPTSLVASVAIRGMRPIFAGICLGLIGAFWTGQLIKAQLVDMSPADPVTLFAVVALLAAIALLATVRPGARVASLDPMIVLREE